MWECPNRGGDRVSTISLQGCSTSVALAMGPTCEEEEEEEEEFSFLTCMKYRNICNICSMHCL